MNNKFKRNQYVNLHIQGKEITFCYITALKDCETGYRYDLTVDNVKLYDISEDLLTSVEEQVSNNNLRQQF